LPYARPLAKTLKIPVEVVAAVDPVSVTTSINGVPGGFLNSHIENCVRESGRYLDRIARTFPGLAITCSVDKGRPEEIITERAARDPVNAYHYGHTWPLGPGSMADGKRR
jgi:hypothetical protein